MKVQSPELLFGVISSFLNKAGVTYRGCKHKGGPGFRVGSLGPHSSWISRYMSSSHTFVSSYSSSLVARCLWHHIKKIIVKTLDKGQLPATLAVVL